ncbi:acetyl-CoA hydrolase/transferase C-terminal domain-containing protein [Cryptosporangium aurantiacum]|uniref:Acyl-CoA hydrolase n=1 Tax=Cryptosporangium aurantiacum TaxID=134849 RepID=A0A1M7PN04_9ACTN|nr:acetyl-CoA hydrolase/transferase C-terminal domain-containing protein [Cryptosporangium aurantiacum]SHN18696.1 Acyl-CoA hydrolase [Cryptosporangium aurantiacum]
MTRLGRLLRPGMRVAIGDGLGAPRSASRELSVAAREVGDIRLLLGWVPVADPELDLTAFADVRTVMSGWGLRRPIEAGLVHAVPARLSAVPALLAGPLRPDVLLATVVPRSDGGYGFRSEVSWQPAAVDAGALVAGVVAPPFPRADAGPPLPSDRLVLVGESSDPPLTLATASPGPEHRAIAERVAGLLPPGARLQVGPGALGLAVLDAVRTPVRVESGLLPDAVVGLDRRGLLLAPPIATYLAGGAELFEWADGKPLLHRIEHTHDLGRLSSGDPFVAVNTALELDAQGQVNVEAVPGAAIGGIGGHPDYAAAATRSVGGLSIVAVSRRSAFVSALSGPVSTQGHDVDVVVTEDGVADLRGLDRVERAAAIAALR